MMYVTFDPNWEHYGTALGNTIFNNLNMEKWIMLPFGRTIIEDVGNSEILGPNAFRLKNTNYVHGSHDLSGGIKNLFLIYREYAPSGVSLECINDGTIIDNWEDFDNKRREFIQYVWET